MTKLYYYILHWITECPDEDLKEKNKNQKVCAKCGRDYIIWRFYQ